MRTLAAKPSALVVVCIAGFAVVWPTLPAGAQQVYEAEIKGAGSLRTCDANGDHLDSVSSQYGKVSHTYVAGPDPGLPTATTCLSQTQSFETFQTADPIGHDSLGYRMVSQNRINVTVEPEFTSTNGMSALTRGLCFADAGPRMPRVTVVLQARARRSIPEACLGRYGEEVNVGACSSAVGRFGGLGDGRFVNPLGVWSNPEEFQELTAPGAHYWVQITRMAPDVEGGWTLWGALSATLLTHVAETRTGSAFGDLRFYVAMNKRTGGMLACEIDAGLGAPDPIPFPSWVIDEGDAIPDDFTLAISPPTGLITLPQSFDLSLMAATGGASITGLTGTIDGQDVSGALAACLAPSGTLHGVTGPILTCRGLSGRMLAGFFGTGAHTLAIAASLSDGRTISDSATWTIVP